MEYTFFDFLMLVGSLGLFLYGMKIMSEGLQKLAGNRLRSILSAMTRNRVMGVLTGLTITAIIQSSSATTVMVVSFVNAGLLSLVQSIGVIMGANIGTTATAWLISLFGFGKFSISALSIPLMGIAIPLVFSSKNKRKSMGEFIFGFAFLFMGLDYLKASMPDLQNNPEVLSFVQNFSDMGFASVLIYVLIGTVITLIVQSSSATVAITLIMATKGWIDFPSAAAMILGENIGTTITANIAAIPANIAAKRAAFSHFMFNVFGVIWVLIVFKYFVGMVEYLVERFGPSNPELATTYGLSLFHTMFNVCNVLVMIWFVNLYEKICLKVIRPRRGEEEDGDFGLQYITTGMLSTAELSILQAEKEVELYAKRVRKMLGFVEQMTNMNHNDKKFLKLYNRLEKYEEISDRMEIEIGSYLGKVTEGRLSNESKEHIRSILREVSEIESVADACCKIGRHLKRKMDADIVFGDELVENVNSMYELLKEAFDNMQKILASATITEQELIASRSIEDAINEQRNLLKRKNIESLNNLEYSYQASVYYMDIISECEQMGDYIINVIESIKIKNRG
jgi:phosphate:Na+ symporter